MTPTKLTLFRIRPDLRERVRLAIRCAVEVGERPSARAIARDVSARRQSVNYLLALYRQGVLSIETTWDDSLNGEVLGRRIDEATTDALRAQLCNDLSKAMHLGQVQPSVGRAMGALIGEARLCDRAARDQAGEGQRAQPIYLLSRAALLVARAFDKVLSDETRSGLVDHVEAVLLQDVEEFPNPTTHEIAAIREAEVSRDL